MNSENPYEYFPGTNEIPPGWNEEESNETGSLFEVFLLYRGGQCSIAVYEDYLLLDGHPFEKPIRIAKQELLGKIRFRLNSIIMIVPSLGICKFRIQRYGNPEETEIPLARLELWAKGETEHNDAGAIKAILQKNYPSGTYRTLTALGLFYCAMTCIIPFALRVVLSGESEETWFVLSLVSVATLIFLACVNFTISILLAFRQSWAIWFVIPLYVYYLIDSLGVFALFLAGIPIFSPLGIMISIYVLYVFRRDRKNLRILRDSAGTPG